MKQKKDEYIHIRVSKDQRQEIRSIASNYGYKSMSKFIIDSMLNTVGYQKDENEKVTHIITFTPTIDYYINIENESGNVHRFKSDKKRFVAGGRGINVSILLNVFNQNNITVHYSGGFVGSHIWDILERLNVNQKRIKSPNESRINMKIQNLNNEDVIIDQEDDEITDFAKDKFKEYINSNVKQDECVVIAGSFIQKDEDFIIELSKMVKNKKAKLYFNMRLGDNDKIVKECKPELITFNLMDKEKKYTKNNILKMIDELINNGAKSVGLIVDTNFVYFGFKDERYALETPIYNKQWTIGLADALMAGYIATIDSELEERMLIACATAAAKSILHYDVTYKDIAKYKKEITIKKL